MGMGLNGERRLEDQCLGLAPSLEWAYFVNYAFLLLETWLFFSVLPNILAKFTWKFLEEHASVHCPGARNEPSSFGRPTSSTKKLREGVKELRPDQLRRTFASIQLPILGSNPDRTKGFWGHSGWVRLSITK